MATLHCGYAHDGVSNFKDVLVLLSLSIVAAFRGPSFCSIKYLGCLIKDFINDFSCNGAELGVRYKQVLGYKLDSLVGVAGDFEAYPIDTGEGSLNELLSLFGLRKGFEDR